MYVIKAEPQYATSLKEAMESADNSGLMLYDPGERVLTEQGCQLFIEHIAKQKSTVLFTAIKDEAVVGYVMVKGDDTNRTSHRAYIAIGVHENYRGQGVGSLLFSKVHEWARERNLSRLELTVLAKNSGAIHLYEKLGYEREGIKRNSLKINGELEDEIFMSKLL